MSSMSSTNSDDSDGTYGVKRTLSNFEDELGLPPAKKREIMTPALSHALDGAGVSGRKATRIIAATLVSAGLDLDDFNFSHSTSYRRRIEHRTRFAQQLKENLRVADSLVVHFDGKLLPDISGSGEIVDRFPIIVSGLDTEQLLGVPKLGSGTGAAQATAIIDTIEDFDITDRVKALCFDTTSTNTGK